MGYSQAVSSHNHKYLKRDEVIIYQEQCGGMSVSGGRLLEVTFGVITTLGFYESALQKPLYLAI